MTEDLIKLLSTAASHAAAFRAEALVTPGKPRQGYREMRDQLLGPVPEQGSSSQDVLEELVAVLQAD